MCYEFFRISFWNKFEDYSSSHPVLNLFGKVRSKKGCDIRDGGESGNLDDYDEKDDDEQDIYHVRIIVDGSGSGFITIYFFSVL